MIIEVKVSDIYENPENPRTLNKKRFEALKKSIKEFPEMLKIRPIVISEENIILGGNMRFKAVVELGYKTIPVLSAVGLNDAQIKEFVIKDNEHFGEWDWDVLANDWDRKDLEDWGLQGFPFEGDLEEEKIKEVEENKETCDKCGQILKIWVL